MKCLLLEYSDTRRKYIIKHENDNEFFVGYLIVEMYQSHWNIELMNVLEHEQRKGYGTQLLNYLINDMKSITNKLFTYPITEESRSFFSKNGFKRDSDGNICRIIN